MFGCQLLLLLAMPTLGAVHSQAYEVDTEGGPLGLVEELAEAAAAWSQLLGDEGLREQTGADNLIAFADPDLMGPDTVSLTLVHEGAAGLEIRLHPQLYRDYPAALAHELGLILGLSTGGEGVMAAGLVAGGPRLPGELEAEALAAVQRRLPGDVDGDSVVGFTDLLALGRAWGQRGLNLPADLDGDGVVGEGDLAILREHYTFQSPAAAPTSPDGAGAPAPASASQEGDSSAGSTSGAANGGEPTSGEVQPGPIDPQGGSGATAPGDGQDER